MRISDWSSDVCSSDLLAAFANDGRPSLDARLQPAIADGEQAPRTAQVRTVAYASVAKPAASPGQPVVTFTAEREGERSEEHTSELQSLMRISYAVFCLKKKKQHKHKHYQL